MQTLLKVLAIIAVIWIGFMMLGVVFKFLIWAVVIGAVLFAATAAYTAVKGRSDRHALGRR
ncbi:MAG: hypothetical protein ACRDSH_11880 [Pseudonocardiaceae bacterium]